MNKIGEIIKLSRESKSISIEEVSEILFISKDVLSSIEEGKPIKYYDKVYYIGHLRAYCNFLNLNTDELIKEFKNQLSYNKKVNIEIIQKPSFKNNLFILQKFAPVTLISFIFVSFYFLFLRDDGKKIEYALTPDLPESYEHIVEKSDLETAKLKKNIKLNVKEINENYSYTSANASVNIDNTNNKDTITLKLLNPTWLQIRDSSDNIILSKLMEKDEVFTYKANLQYTVTAGNAGNILVIVNSIVKGKVGKYGEVVDSILIDNSFNN